LGNVKVFVTPACVLVRVRPPMNSSPSIPDVSWSMMYWTVPSAFE